MVSQGSDIKVALSEQGYKLYKSILYLRPNAKIDKDGDKWILTLSCAEEQVKNYFFQFASTNFTQFSYKSAVSTSLNEHILPA